MAKKKTTKKKMITVNKSRKTRNRIVDKKRDAETIKKIDTLAEKIVKSSLAQREPNFEIPTRSISNMKYNKKKRILEMVNRMITRIQNDERKYL